MPDWDKIAKKQQRAYRAMYDLMEVAERDREARESAEKARVKKYLRELLKEDPEFQKEVKKILKQGK
ncbi:MAG: hypothetical protein Q8R34_01095 [bacterium]|nr:hypothetical protein [bacterium]